MPIAGRGEGAAPDAPAALMLPVQRGNKVLAVGAGTRKSLCGVQGARLLGPGRDATGRRSASLAKPRRPQGFAPIALPAGYLDKEIVSGSLAARCGLGRR
jgi:hypothetical protein